MDLSFRLNDTHVLITGGSGYIGSATVEALLAAGARVTSLDLEASRYLAQNANFRHISCDITDESALQDAFKSVGFVNCCIALASLDLSVLPHHESLADMPVEQWRKTHRVNVEGTFLTARTWLRQLRDHVHDSAGMEGNPASTPKNVSLVIVGSESGHFGERGNADYAAGKSAVQLGLVKSLLGDVSRIWPSARVNAVAPGPVDTEQFKRECEANPAQYWLDAQATTGLAKPVPPEAVARSILFLANESWSGSITGQILNVDSGKQGKVIWPKEDCQE